MNTKRPNSTHTHSVHTVHTVNIVRNYMKFGPLMQATTYVQRALGFEQTMTLTSIEYDNVPDATFDPPAEVKALLSR